MTHSKLDAALVYASWGWPVLPVIAGDKTPATAHGYLDATTDPDKIKAWWKRNPDFNIGIAAGEKSGLTIIDIDPRNGGSESWHDWIEEHGAGDIIECPTQLTAGGGVHYLAKYTPELRSCKISEGIDLLADGRYFLAYPSEVNGNQYVWEAAADPFDPEEPAKCQIIPENWIEAIRGVKRPLFSKDGTIIQGARNEALTSLAGSMRRVGFSEASILAALGLENEQRCEPPLPASDIRRIAKSISSKPIEDDIADSMSRGTLAALALFGEQELSFKTGFHFTRGGAFFKQPSPIPWVIKRWIPQGGTGMIFGASGIGKTFVAVDIACSIVVGKQWGGVKTAQGTVVYMAGEGNYGMRQRVVAWALQHNYRGEDFDNLLISNEPLNLDSPGADSEVIRAIKEVTDEPISVVFIDTLNRHMSGDENSAQDTRKLMNVCGVIALATGAAVILVHHTGHGETSKGRERGSSALRGALDVSIKVSKPAKSKTVTVECVKMKDAKEPKAVHCEIVSVDLGWVDEDGEAEEPAGAIVHVESDEVDIDALLAPKDPKTAYQTLGFETYGMAARTKGRLTQAGLFDGVHLDAWRALFYERLGDKKAGTKNAAFNRMLKDMVSLKYVEKSDNYYYPAGDSANSAAEEFAECLKNLLPVAPVTQQ